LLCILSLFFGGLLWPFAVAVGRTPSRSAYRAIYGTEKHEDYYIEMGEKARAGALPGDELAHLRAELAEMESKGALRPELKRLARISTPSPRRRAPCARPSPSMVMPRNGLQSSSASMRSSSG